MLIMVSHSKDNLRNKVISLNTSSFQYLTYFCLQVEHLVETQLKYPELSYKPKEFSEEINRQTMYEFLW